MPKVFVTQEVNRINYAPALEYGEVTFLTTDEYKPEPTNGKTNARITSEVINNLKDYVPGVDYILTSGSPIPMLIVGNNLRPGVRHKILKWNNQSNKYDLCLL